METQKFLHFDGEPARPEDSIPSVRQQEDALFQKIRDLTERAPDPLAPIAERSAYAEAWTQLRIEAERIAMVHGRAIEEEA